MWPSAAHTSLNAHDNRTQSTQMASFSSVLTLFFFHILWSESPISCHNLVYIWTISFATNLAIASSSTYHFQTALVNRIFFQTTAVCFTSLSHVFLPQSVKSSKVNWILSTKNKQRISDFLWISASVSFFLIQFACLQNKLVKIPLYLLQHQFVLKFMSFTNHILNWP